MQICMTAVALEALDDGCRETGLSKPDYIEWLIRKERGLPLQSLTAKGQPRVNAATAAAVVSGPAGWWRPAP